MKMEKSLLSRKMDLVVRDLEARGVRRSTAAPPLYRLAWRLGIAMPPPLFQGLFTITFVMGPLFGFAWWAAMSLVTGPLDVMYIVIAGLPFGACMAAYYRWKAYDLRLPRWKEFRLRALGELESWTDDVY